jgi:hypothetical protein
MRGAAMLPRSTACQPATHLAPARDAPLGISDAYRHLVAKIPRTRRWRVTEQGRQMLGRVVQLYYSVWPELAA